jgi:hypothetical protein
MRTLPDFCEYAELIGPSVPCYQQAHHVLVRPSGETLRFSCTPHLPAWASRVRGRYLVLSRETWEAQGGGYRGRHLGG